MIYTKIGARIVNPSTSFTLLLKTPSEAILANQP